MATIRDTLNETQIDYLNQFDAENGITGGPEPTRPVTTGYVPNTVRHPTGQPIERDEDGTRHSTEWTKSELNLIALGVQGKLNWSDHDTYTFRRDLLRQLKSLISFCDFDEDLDFVCYEMASSLCMNAYVNGKRTADKHQRSLDALREMERQTNNMEWDDNKAQLLTRRESGYANRLWFWREFYAAARQAYRETAADLGPNFAQWISAEWTPPDVVARQKARTKRNAASVASRAELQQRLAAEADKDRARDEERERVEYYSNKPDPDDDAGWSDIDE